MKPRSAKAKGRRFQQQVRELLLETFKEELHPDDLKVSIMGESGTDVKLSPAARQKIPYSIECKNVEKLNIWAALQQAEDNTTEGTTPLLVFSRNRSKNYVAFNLDHFLKLLKK